MVNVTLHSFRTTLAVANSRLQIVLLTGLLLFAALVPLVSAQDEPAIVEDWPQFRANQWNTGTSPAEAPDTDELYWVFEATPNPSLPWGFYSSAAVIDHVVYIGCGNGYLYALDEASGAVIWEFVVDDYAPDFPYPVLSSPAVDTDRGVVYFAADGLYAIDMDEGTLRWKFDTGYWYEWWSSPSFDEDTVYIGSGSANLYAIDADSGNQKWVFETGEREYNPLTGEEVNKEAGGAISATAAVGPELVYIVDWDENLYAVDKDDGEMIFIQGFEDTIPGTNTPIEWGPIDMAAGRGMASVTLDLENNMLFLGDTYGKVWGISMDSDDNGIDDDFDGKVDNEGNVIWDYETGDAITASAALYEGIVYVGSWDMIMYAFDAVSGSIRWQQPIDGVPWGGQTAADGKVFVTTAWNEDSGAPYGNIYAFDAETGNEVWSMRVDNYIFAHATPYNDKLIVGEFTGMHLAALGMGGPKPDLYVADLTVSDETSDGERIVYTTIGNKKNTVLSPPFEVQIFVDDKLKYNESYDALAPGDLTAANVKLDLGGGSHEIEVRVIQRPTGWYHIPETNLGNNKEAITVGGVMNMLGGESDMALPMWFLLGLIIGAGVMIFVANRRREEDTDFDLPMAFTYERRVDLNDEVEEGKFITSEKAKRYHVSKCPFAVNIPRKGGIIVTIEEATELGKKPCQCTGLADDTKTKAKKSGEQVLDAETV